MKIKGDINKMIRNKIPQGVFPWTATLNYSARDITLLLMSPPGTKGRGETGISWSPAEQSREFHEVVSGASIIEHPSIHHHPVTM